MTVYFFLYKLHLILNSIDHTRELSKDLRQRITLLLHPLLTKAQLLSWSMRVCELPKPQKCYYNPIMQHSVSCELRFRGSPNIFAVSDQSVQPLNTTWQIFPRNKLFPLAYRVFVNYRRHPLLDLKVSSTAAMFVGCERTNLWLFLVPIRL